MLYVIFLYFSTLIVSHALWSSVFTLNFLPYKPTGPVSSNIYRPEFENYINDHELKPPKLKT
jgi:hypothetical protein